MTGGWFFTLLCWMPQGADAEVFLTQKQALEIAFPQARVERQTVYLVSKQVQEIERLARAKLKDRMIVYYVGRSSHGVMGYAFFETHMVRTMPETFMLVLNPTGGVQFVELLAFYEPQDYRPPPRWLALFGGRRLDEDLWVKRGIRNITGATLTARAVTEGVRRVLATFNVVVWEKKP